MTSHRWSFRRKGPQLIVDVDDVSTLTADDVDALVAATEREVVREGVSSVVLDGDAIAAERRTPSLMAIVRVLGGMVNRHRKAFTLHL